MNDDILIELGEVSEETKGCPGGSFEQQVIPSEHDKTGDPPTC